MNEKPAVVCLKSGIHCLEDEKIIWGVNLPLLLVWTEYECVRTEKAAFYHAQYFSIESQ